MSKHLIETLLNGEPIHETAYDDYIKTIKERTDYEKPAEAITKERSKIHGAQPVFDKSVKPEEGDRTLDFIKMPTNLRYYSYMSDYGMTESAMMLYQLIIDYFNKEEKKAYPSQYRLAMEIGKSVRTINHNLKILRSVGLLQVRRTGIGANNEYRPLLPLTPRELFERYPKALERYVKHEKAVRKIRRRDEKRKQDKEAEWE
ncbi:helix-turn-helix domain-containing protein [Bacillus sp. DU-106]|uniref:helix-turn-helix domain-containing protein n=1 Tax=Bacillus TaxID=1386 RepID=UPI0010A49B07|nr:MULTISPECIES: helix-turn-helix domain-containing protein [Bacillus]QCC42617.1 helix-turn-helix domain-containing protein [Bacillus sp. DU-106]QUW36298.1 helix-turn-helix domain-containing protein [Bacillus cereus]